MKMSDFCVVSVFILINLLPQIVGKYPINPELCLLFVLKYLVNLLRSKKPLQMILCLREHKMIPNDSVSRWFLERNLEREDCTLSIWSSLVGIWNIYINAVKNNALIFQKGSFVFTILWRILGLVGEKSIIFHSS